MRVKLLSNSRFSGAGRAGRVEAGLARALLELAGFVELGGDEGAGCVDCKRDDD